MYTAPISPMKVTIGGGFGGARNHHGVDLVCASGTPVRAPIGGQYVRSGFSTTNGHYGIWLGDDGNYWNMQHLIRSFDTRGRIEAGQPVAVSGATGNVSGPHLHVGVSTRNSLTLGTFDPTTLFTEQRQDTQMRVIRNNEAGYPTSGWTALVGEFTFTHHATSNEQRFDSRVWMGGVTIVDDLNNAEFTHIKTTTEARAAAFTKPSAAIPVDYAALAEAVNDEAAKRLAN